jgi:Chlorophyll A-B binding protein
MKTAILLTLVSSAAAFVAPSTRSSTALSMSFADEPGVLLPTGYFDPLRLATTQEKFDKYRAAEIKHGRVAMLAVVGYVVPEFYRWGGDIAPGLAFKDIPNGVAAIEAVPFLGWAQILILVGAVDSVRCLFGVHRGTSWMMRSTHISSLFLIFLDMTARHSPI